LAREKKKWLEKRAGIEYAKTSKKLVLVSASQKGTFLEGKDLETKSTGSELAVKLERGGGGTI